MLLAKRKSSVNDSYYKYSALNKKLWVFSDITCVCVCVFKSGGLAFKFSLL